MNYQPREFRAGVTKRCPTCGHMHKASGLDGLQIDHATGSVALGGWSTKVEAKHGLVLEAIAAAFPRGVTKGYLIDAAYGRWACEIMNPEQAIDTAICRLRRNLRLTGAPFTIKCRRRAGYWLEMLEPTP
jgi:DNA-binding response OmpR family regulator